MSQDPSDQPPLSAASVWNDDVDRPVRAVGDTRRPVSDRGGEDSDGGGGDPRRVRVRRRSPRRRRRARRIRMVGAGVVVLLAIVATGLLALDAIAVRGHLVAVQNRSGQVQQAVSGDQLDRARELAADARVSAADAAVRSDGPLWAMASWLPFLGDDVRLVDRLVDLAVAGTNFADIAVTGAAPLVSGELELLRGPQQVDLELLGVLGAAADALDPDRLRQSVSEVAAIDPTGLATSELVEARADVLGLAGRTLDAFDRADVALDLLPPLFGADGPRSYLLGLQTNAELRGTGGLMTYFSSVTADDGRVQLLPAVRENELADQAAAELDAAIAANPDASATEDEDVPPAPTFVADTGDDFAQRYDHLAARSDLGNVNVEPDLTITGPVLTSIANQGVATYDGVIMLDPVGLQQLLEGGPPLTVPGGLSQPPLPNPIPIDQLAQVLLIDNYNVLGGDNSGARQPYLKAVSAAAIDRIFADVGDPRALLDNFGRAIATRHLQLWIDDEVDQARVVRLGAGGRMPRPSDGTDVLAVTGNNAAADKKDVHVAHRITAHFDLRDLRLATDGAPSDGEQLAIDGGADVLATRTGTVEVAMVNPLRPGEYDDYIIGSAEPQQLGGPSTTGNRDPNGPARTWFTVWNPLGFGTRSLTVDGEPELFGSGTIHDLAATDYFLEVPLESTRAFRADLLGPVGMVRDGDELVYTLTLWRQAKAIPDEWDLTINAPADLVVRTATLTGGGVPTTGFGPSSPSPLAVATERRGVRVTGGATEDAVLTVRFALP